MIDWRQIYWWRTTGGATDNNQLPRPLPFTNDFDQNISDTLEWLIRKFVAEFDREEPFIRRVGKSRWYHLEHQEGCYYHVCDAKLLLKFRNDYNSAHMNLVGDGERNLTIAEMEARRNMIKLLREKCQQLIYAMWGVIGRDGWSGQFLAEYNEEFQLMPKLGTGVEKFTHKNNLGYRWYCHKCGEELPKGTKAWIKLNAIER